jgi:phosphate transport system substrate-binding protein
VKPRQLIVLVVAGLIALTVGACGSSSKSSSSSSSSGGSSSTAGGGSSSGGGTINGAGSTFAQPVYQQWGSDLKNQNVTVNYQGVGSGTGVAQWTQGSVDFAATDPPLKDEEVTAAKKKGQAVHIPTFFGAITIAYNLPGVPAGLKLDGKTAAGIFLGKIKKWNDPAIASQNAGAKLPATDIAVVHRSDSSGTTKGFTTFLSAYSSDWKSKVGADKTVKWPTGTGAAKNAGVAAGIKQQEGGIGYVEEAYALQNNFTTAQVKNSSGKYVAPTLETTTAAGEGIKVPSDLRFTTINSPNKAAYPIVSQTFVVVYKDLCKAGVKPDAAKAIDTFLTYGLGAGQESAKKLQFAPLPAPVVAKAKTAVESLQCNGSPISGSTK